MDSTRRAAIENLYHAALAKEPAGRQEFLASACAGDPELRSEVESLLAGATNRETNTLPAVLTPDVWATIERLFHGAMAKEPADRLAFLDAACPPQRDLRQLLEAMLGYHRSADGVPVQSPAAQPAGPPWPEGKQIGPYQIRQRIAADVLGPVYEARESGAGRAVALRAIRPELAARLRGAYPSLLPAHHPRLCDLYQVGREEEVDYLAMELVAGERLSRWLRRGPLPLHTALAFAIELCDVLDYTHRQGIVHRDLRPAHIVVAGSHIKLLDLGAAKALEPAASTSERVLTALSVMAEAPCLSPEQILGQTVDERSDIFSLGSILYEVVTGERPFARPSLQDSVMALLSEEPQPLAYQGAPVSADLEGAILRCLRKRPEERFASVSELKRALQAVPSNAPSIGPYRILRELGRGDMGVVYLARDPDIGRDVAVKTIQLAPFANAAAGARLRGRFLREARAAGSLSHPGIVTVHQLGEHEGQPYIVMEFIDGGSLERYMPGSPHAAKKEWLIKGLRTVAEALDYAHGRSVVHRDIKPGNILITRTGTFKVADFGIAKILDESDMSTTRGVIGTPMYLAPEQLRGSAASARSDQYALGVIAYQIAARRPPFTAKTTEELFFQIISATPAPPSSLNPNLHPGVDPLFARVLSKEPAQRFTSCAEFAAALDAAVRHPGPKAKPAPAPQPPQPQPSQPPQPQPPQPQPPQPQPPQPQPPQPQPPQPQPPQPQPPQPQPPQPQPPQPHPPQHRPPQPQPQPAASRKAVIALGIALAVVPIASLTIYTLRHTQTAGTPAQHPVADSTPATAPLEPMPGPEEGTGAVPAAHRDEAVHKVPAAPATAPTGSRQVAGELYDAIDKGYAPAAIQEILSRGPMINGTAPDKVPLTMAAARCQPDDARLLLSKGADPNAPYSNGMAAQSDAPATPLTMAAFSGCPAVAEILLDHGAKPNLIAHARSGAAASAQDPALVHAVQGAYQNTQKGPDYDRIVQLLLDHGADPNLHEQYSWPPLLVAAGGCLNTIAGRLLDRNANSDITEFRDKETPLMAAAASVCEPVVTGLLAKRAKVNQADAQGRNALYYLLYATPHSDQPRYRECLAMARELITAGANPSAVMRERDPSLEITLGTTPLMIVSENGLAEIIRLLLDHGADPKAADAEGRTALMYVFMDSTRAVNAPAADREATVDLLLARGASVNARDKRGKTALAYARQLSGGQALIDLLVKAGAVE